MVQLDTKYRQQLRDIVHATPKTQHYKFVIFGSRVTGKARQYSDIDLGILSDEPVPLSVLADLEDRLESSYLPYKVDVVDLNRTESDFQAVALKHTEEL